MAAYFAMALIVHCGPFSIKLEVISKYPYGKKAKAERGLCIISSQLLSVGRAHLLDIMPHIGTEIKLTTPEIICGGSPKKKTKRRKCFMGDLIMESATVCQRFLEKKGVNYEF
jgi:hypothetical protein